MIKLTPSQDQAAKNIEKGGSLKTDNLEYIAGAGGFLPSRATFNLDGEIIRLNATSIPWVISSLEMELIARLGKEDGAARFQVEVQKILNLL